MSQDKTGSMLSDPGLYGVLNTNGSIVGTEKVLFPIHEQHYGLLTLL